MSFQVGQQAVICSFGDYRLVTIVKKINQHSVLVKEGANTVSMRIKELGEASRNGISHTDKVYNRRTDEFGIVNYFQGVCVSVTVLTKHGMPSIPGMWNPENIEKVGQPKEKTKVQTFQVGDEVNTNPALNDALGVVTEVAPNENVKVQWGFGRNAWVTSYPPENLQLINRAIPKVQPDLGVQTEQKSTKYDHTDAKALFQYNKNRGWPNNWEYSANEGKSWVPIKNPVFNEHLQYRVVKDQAKLVPAPVPNPAPAPSNSHPHAKHIIEWATREASGQPNVWESTWASDKNGDGWVLDHKPSWSTEFQYRLRTEKEFFMAYNEQQDVFTNSSNFRKADLKIVMKNGKIASVEILNKETK
jgi:hypothetical protein